MRFVRKFCAFLENPSPMALYLSRIRILSSLTFLRCSVEPPKRVVPSIFPPVLCRGRAFFEEFTLLEIFFFTSNRPFPPLLSPSVFCFCRVVHSPVSSSRLMIGRSPYSPSS